MITSTNITRRTFLSGLFYLGSLEFLGIGWNLDKLCARGHTDALASKLANIHVDKQSAKIVGVEYLRSVPLEAKANVLIDLICSFDGGQRAEFAQADNQKLTELLRLQQRQDFEHGRVVNLHGWILSKTECRVCALAALI
jgi:hypothetical protein